MTRLYIEIGAGLVLFVASLLFGWHFGSLGWKGKYDAIVIADTQASADAATAATKRIQDDRERYDTDLKTIADTYHRELSESDVNADGLSQQLRDYESRLSRCGVPKGTASPVRSDAPAAQPSRDSEITNALAAVVKAAGDDATQLIALQSERRSLNQESK